MGLFDRGSLGTHVEYTSLEASVSRADSAPEEHVRQEEEREVEKRDKLGAKDSEVAGSQTKLTFRDSLAILSSFAVQVYIPSVFVFGANGLVIPVIPPFARKVFKANDQQSGMVMSSLSLAGVFLDIPGAFLIAKLGADLSGVFSGATLFLSGIVGALAPNIFILSLSRFMHGLGQVTWLTSRTFIFSLSKRSSRAEKYRGLLISGVGGTQRISNLLMPMLGSFVAVRFGYRAPFMVVSAFGALVFPFALLSYSRETRLNQTSATAERKEERNSKAVVFRYFRMIKEIFAMNWLELLTVGSPCLVLNMLRQARDFLFAVAAMNAGFSQDQIGLLISSMYLMDFLSFPVSGYLMDKFGRKHALVASLSCISLGCVMLSMLTGTGRGAHKTMLFLVASVAGSGSGIGAGIAMCMGADLANVAQVKFKESSRGGSDDSDVKALFLGIFRTSQDLGQMFGPQLVGTLSKQVSLSFSGLLCGSIGILAALFSVCCVKETKDLAMHLLHSKSAIELDGIK